jgi:5-(carboxyamino)imidazole ribonucleotide mutase
MKEAKARVGIIMGSDSDWPLIQNTAQTLDGFGVAHEVRVISAHRNPSGAQRYASTAARRGIRVLIAAAGGAAHLAGALSANSTLPVIGIPVPGGSLGGMDALLSTVQMPSGVPVATVAVGQAGAVNAAILAVQILALGDPALARKLASHKKALLKKTLKGDAHIQSELKKVTTHHG